MLSRKNHAIFISDRKNEMDVDGKNKEGLVHGWQTYVAETWWHKKMYGKKHASYVNCFFFSGVCVILVSPPPQMAAVDALETLGYYNLSGLHSPQWLKEDSRGQELQEATSRY